MDFVLCIVKKTIIQLLVIIIGSYIIITYKVISILVKLVRAVEQKILITQPGFLIKVYVGLLPHSTVVVIVVSAFLSYDLW